MFVEWYKLIITYLERESVRINYAYISYLNTTEHRNRLDDVHNGFPRPISPILVMGFAFLT